MGNRIIIKITYTNNRQNQNKKTQYNTENYIIKKENNSNREKIVYNIDNNITYQNDEDYKNKNKNKLKSRNIFESTTKYTASKNKRIFLDQYKINDNIGAGKERVRDDKVCNQEFID